MDEGWNVWPKREYIKEKDRRGEPLTPHEMFILASRTFVPAVKHLQDLKGAQEYNKRIIVELLYALARWADEGEDGNITIPRKKEALGKVSYIVSEVARRDPGASLDDLINHELKEVTAATLEGPASEHAEIFLRNFGRGEVLYHTLRQERPIKEVFRDCIGTMTSGMEHALERRELRTLEDVDNYVYYVAGIVGESLGKITYIVDSAPMDLMLSRSFGKLLQLTNILKNIKEDNDARSNFPDSRTLFLPRELYPEVTPQELIYSDEPRVKKARESTFERMLELTKQNIGNTAQYIAAIPRELSGYRAFCLSPFLAAVETIKTMEKEGAHKVFRGVEDAVKISHEHIGNILDFTEKIVYSERMNEWIQQYSCDARQFSFKNGGFLKKYEKWSAQWLKESDHQPLGDYAHSS